MQLAALILLFPILCGEVFAEPTNCTCVLFLHCSDDGSQMISDGRGLLEVRKSRQCDGVFEVCCNNTITTSPSPVPAKRNDVCGLHSHETFPWSASLLFKQYPNFVASYRCHVSLLHGRVALTAAHCLQDKGHYQVRIGSTIRKVVQTVIHPQFKKGSLHNNIALLFLNKPFKTDKIGNVCVPPPESMIDGTSCTTATQQDNGNLKIIHLPIVPRDKCVGLLRNSTLGSFFQLHESFICAGGNGEEDTCIGDGGSPLICPVQGLRGRFQQVGIVSWGIGCGGDVPGVYVNLGLFRHWIDDVMVQNGLQIDAYRF